MAAVAKNLSGSGVLFTDRRDFYISPQVIKELWTDVAPFTTVVANREQRTPTDPLFKMFEHRNPWQKQEFSSATDVASLAAGDSASGNMDVDGITGLSSSCDDSWLGLVCQVWNEDKDTLRGLAVVSSITDSNTIKYKNLNHASNALDVADNDVFVVVGNAHGEGTTAPEAWSDELNVVYNSTQIFKTSLQITGTLEAAALRGESSELARLRLMKSQEHKIQKERAFLFGGSRAGTNLSTGGAGSETFADGSTTDADGNTVRTTTGVVEAIRRYGASSGDDQNNFTISEATYSYNSFVDDMEKVFQYVPEAGSKIAFAGRGAMSYWSKIEGASGLAGSSGWNIHMGPTERNTLGFNYRQLETPHGVLMLVPTPVLRGPYNKYMVVVSEENLFHSVYRPPVYQTNIKTDDAFDGVKDQYMSDEGVGITLLESHKLFSITD